MGIRIVVLLALSVVVTALVFLLGRESPKDTKAVRALKQFAFLEVLLVVAPWFLLTLAYLIPSLVWLVSLFLANAYYFLPRLIFGGAHFKSFYAALFPDLIGTIQAAAVYSAIAALLSLLQLLPSRAASIKCSRCGAEIDFEAAACAQCGFRFASGER